MRIVDPRPQVEEMLRQLAAEHEPRLAERAQAVRDAVGWRRRRGAKRELKRAERQYRDARSEARAVLGMTASW